MIVPTILSVNLENVLAVTCLVAIIAVSSDGAHAQQDFGVRQGFGIPVSEAAIGIVLIIALYAIVLAYIHESRKRAIGGGIVVLSSLAIVAFATPIYMHSFYAGSTHPYCNDHPCDGPAARLILNIASFPELAHHTVLNKAVFASIHEGYNNCCAITPVNYFEELSFYLSAADSTIRLSPNPYSYDEAYLFKMRGEYYTISFHHPDDDFNYAYSGTMFTIDVVYLLTILPALSFFSIMLPVTAKTTESINLAQLSRKVKIARWVAARRLVILVIGIVALVAGFVLSLWLGSDYHQSTYDLLIYSIISIVIWIGIVIATRTIIRLYIVTRLERR